MTIEHVSDTARWVAMYRAMESERPDALFHDPFARRLAGEKGRRIVDGIRQGQPTERAIIVRTAVMDEILGKSVAGGTDTVVNLAAGLDTRPWRMDLPPGLRWTDVDFDGILDHKLEALAGETPTCVYRDLRADLTDGDARRRVLAEAIEGSRRALVLTEGLLVYLAPEDVAALARDLHAVEPLHAWLTDLASPRILRMMQRRYGAKADAGNASFRFAPAEGSAFFEPFGWKETVFRSTGEEAYRLGRDMPGGWVMRLISRFASAERKEAMRRMAGVLLMERR